jgi:Shikimate 5-dehydrogenase
MDGHTRVYGLIGDPVEHSLSPLIHNSIAEMFKENFVYVPIAC